MRTPSNARAELADNFAAMAIEKPALKGLRGANRVQWLKPEIRIRAQHLKAKGNAQACHCETLLDDSVRLRPRGNPRRALSKLRLRYPVSIPLAMVQAWAAET